MTTINFRGYIIKEIRFSLFLNTKEIRNTRIVKDIRISVNTRTYGIEIFDRSVNAKYKVKNDIMSDLDMNILFFFQGSNICQNIR